MTLNPRRVLLWVLVLLGLYVGVWAAFFPRVVLRLVPGPVRPLGPMYGPYNEHLIKDVGTLNPGLAVASAVASHYVDPGPGVAVGLAWTVYSVPYLAYHLRHLHHFDAVAPGHLPEQHLDLADAAKFSRTAPAFVAPVSDLSVIVTADATDDDLTALAEAGATVQVA